MKSVDVVTFPTYYQYGYPTPRKFPVTIFQGNVICRSSSETERTVRTDCHLSSPMIDVVHVSTVLVPTHWVWVLVRSVRWTWDVQGEETWSGTVAEREEEKRRGSQTERERIRLRSPLRDLWRTDITTPLSTGPSQTNTVHCQYERFILGRDSLQWLM